MPDFVGTNTANPGVYDVAREKAGPDAFTLKTGIARADLTAKFLNRDVLKAGNPGDANFISGASARRVHGFDNGRAFMSAVCCDNVLVEDFVAEHTAHSMLNCEPEGNTKGVTSVVMRHGQVGESGYFLLGSKGANLPASALLEDVSQIPGTVCGNGLWVAAIRPGIKSFVLRRVAVDVSGVFGAGAGTGVAGRPITDRATVRDGHANVLVDVWSDPSKAFFTVNCDVTFEDVWVDGRPITEADVQWQWARVDGVMMGVAPKIVHTPGWDPSKIAPPVGVPGYTTPPPPPPVDPCADVRAELAEARSSVVDLTAQLAVAKTEASDAYTQAATLQAKIDRVRAELG